jgi:hypothetical protein
VKTGVQGICKFLKILDSGFRRNDEKRNFYNFYKIIIFGKACLIFQQQVPAFFSGAELKSFVSATQQQAAFFLPRAELMTAAAHPTPAFTAMAFVGQFWAQAPHSMHASRLTIWTFPLGRFKTSWGQTVTHIPQPTHFSSETLRVVTSLR